MINLDSETVKFCCVKFRTVSKSEIHELRPALRGFFLEKFQKFHQKKKF